MMTREVELCKEVKRIMMGAARKLALLAAFIFKSLTSDRRCDFSVRFFSPFSAPRRPRP
jgi:hypothetical protein